MEKIKAFLKRKNIIISAKRYGIDALGAMAQGLFASLLIGTIISTIGEQAGIQLLVDIGGYAKAATGPAMAISIGFALQCPPLVLFSLAAVGVAANTLGGAGGPLAVLIVTIFAAEFGKAVSKETKIDIIVTPFVTIFIGAGLSIWWAPAIGAAASAVGNAIMWATELQPFFMGILVSVIVGIALTLPISSAAICAALGLTGLAGGAAVAGCCANMVGFAVLSFRENKWGGLFAQGIGTSMLQMGNIVRNPRIWLPAILSSAITGPIATCVFHLQMNGAAVASGMGTCGLVGQIGIYTGWINDIASGTKAAITPHVIDESHLKEIIGKLNRTVVRYTQATEEKVKEADCLLIDCFGLLSSIYRYGEIAYIGGGFGVGIHNVLEAAVYGMPVIFGPNNKRFREAQGLLQCKGGFEIQGAEDFKKIMDNFLNNYEALDKAGKKAGNYVRDNAGALEKIMHTVTL